MFYDVFKQLCNDRGETPNSVCIKLGLSQAAAPYWKKSGKRPKRETLEVIAKYFGVSIDLLLERDVQSVRESIISGNMAKENAPTKLSRSELFNILGQLTDSELDEVLDLARRHFHNLRDTFIGDTVHKPKIKNTPIFLVVDSFGNYAINF